VGWAEYQVSGTIPVPFLIDEDCGCVEAAIIARLDFPGGDMRLKLFGSTTINRSGWQRRTGFGLQLENANIWT
jgi:hypothetical protein